VYAGSVFIVIGIIWIVWASVANPKSEQKSEPAKLEKLRVKLKWVHQAQFAGFYVAEEKFYKKQGLEVELLEKGDGENVLFTVASGQADVGIWGAEQILMNRSEGRPVKALGVVYQQTPMCWMVRKESPIRSFADITNEKVGIQPEGNDFNLLYRAVLQHLKIDRKRIKELPVEFSPLVFRSGQVDVFPSYVTNEPFQMEKVGIGVRCISPDSMGIDFYGDTVFATDSTLLQRSDAIRKFMAATVDGWKYASEHVEEAVDITIRKNPALRSERDGEIYKLQQSLHLIQPDKQRALLDMDRRKWESMSKMLVDLQLMKPLDNLDAVFTDKFLPIN
jgi:ABC-type nitrate/sulfonate/bicarbonate transport system substrate-binding protein